MLISLFLSHVLTISFVVCLCVSLCDELHNLNIYRYFTGNTKDPDGTIQFIAGRTKVGDAIDGAIKIITVAVCLLLLNIYLCIIRYAYFYLSQTY